MAAGRFAPPLSPEKNVVTRRPKRFVKPRPELGESGDALALSPLVRAYLDALEVRSFSWYTLKNLEHNLFQFLVWCEARAVTRATDITRPMILRYQRFVFYYRMPNGKPLGIRAQQHRLHCVIGLFRWLTRENILLYNPATEIELPRSGRQLPRNVLTAHEADVVLSQPDITDPLGLRDRAILEVLYSTGLRRMEIVHLNVFDIDLDSRTVTVRQGKGRRDRFVPIGERAVMWVRKYLDEVRAQLAIEPDSGHLFVSDRGGGMGLNTISSLVHDYVEEAGIHKSGSCHLFRHTVATLMLEGGADIRFVQAMMGHENIQSTEIYTHVAIRKLREIHAATHPGAKLKPASESSDEDSDQLLLFEEGSSSEEERIH